jgi:hypothetical protein
LKVSHDVPRLGEDEVADAQLVVQAPEALRGGGDRDVDQRGVLAELFLGRVGLRQPQKRDVARIVDRDLREPEAELDLVDAIACPRCPTRAGARRP